MVSAHTHLFWITSRAAGTTALVLSSVSVGVGLLMGGRLMPGSNPDRRTVHEVLSLSVMVALGVHALSLVGDRYLHPSVPDVLVPFVLAYKTGWTTLGILAGWGTVLLGLSYYVRRRIGLTRWKVIHRFTLLAWGAGLVHSLGEGTDAGQTWFLALVALTAAPAAVALVMRVIGARAPSSQAPLTNS